MEQFEIRAAEKVVGTKQTIRMVEKGLCKKVLIAEDVRSDILPPLLALCRENGVEVLTVASMIQLGELCGIKVGAASAGIL